MPKSCRPLRQTPDTWGDVAFNYISTDSPDFVPSVSVSWREPSCA